MQELTKKQESDEVAEDNVIELRVPQRQADPEPEDGESTESVVEMAELDPELVRTIEALLFLSPEPIPTLELAEATESSEEQVAQALEALTAAREDQGVVVRELAGGYTLASIPEAEDAARRLLGKPRTPPLSAAQAETLAIVGYLQPISRPEIARIRGVSSESATQSLLERGLIEESGRTEFGAILFCVTPLFLKVFGLPSRDDLPDPAQWDPSPEERESLRDRLLQAGDQRSGATQGES
jgi:segregation and condensation protein B